MSNIQTIDDKGYELIAHWEGIRNSAYLDSGSIPTIGIGFIRYSIGAKAGQRVKLGDVMTHDQIKAEFKQQIQSYEQAVRQAVTVPMTQSQFNACVSLCYNIGTAAFARSSVVRRLNERKYRAACQAFAMWDKAGGRIIKGLQRRRAAEQAEFFRMG